MSYPIENIVKLKGPVSWRLSPSGRLLCQTIMAYRGVIANELTLPSYFISSLHRELV